MLRVLLTSDIHNCHITWYGMSNEERMADLVRCLEEAKRERAYDMTLCLGDVSLDFWAWNEGGSYLWDPPVSRTAEFMEKIAPVFPQPFYITPGNHEQYAPEDWMRITGQPREQIVERDEAVFVLLDSFGADLGQSENSDGTYRPVNCALIREALCGAGERPVFLCSHWFDKDAESDEFRALMQNEPQIGALFCGHDHFSYIPHTAEGNLPILHTGHFSYSGDKDPAKAYRGWRELTVYDDGSWESLYRVPEQQIPYPGWRVRMEAHVQDCAAGGK